MASISVSRTSFSRERAAPFSLQEFSDLVSTAFNLAHPTLANPSRLDLSVLPPQSSMDASDAPPSPVSSCFDTDTDDDHAPSSSKQTRQSVFAKHAMSGHLSKSRSPFDVLRQVRTRASAVLRSTNTHLAPPSPEGNLSARPSICSQRTLQSTATSSYSFLSRPPTPTYTPRASSPFPDLTVSRTRSRSKSLTGPASFLKLPKRETSAPIANVRQTTGAPTTSDLPSFFETTGYAERRPPVPAYSRPATPVPTQVQQTRIHTRLPPLRKAKSASTSLFRGKKGKGGRANSTPTDAPPRAALDWTAVEAEGCFTSPRVPPPVPPLPPAAASGYLGVGTDDDGELEVPPYVFERRGSATSTLTTSTMASTKSTSSLSERIASMFSSRLRARSKLSLAITTATADSSPSTDSTRTWSPVTPTGGFTFPPSGHLYTQSEHGHASAKEYAEDTTHIGRVLTPEPDPFAKASVAIARFSTDVTPRPVSPCAKYESRRGSRQSDRRPRRPIPSQQAWDFKDTDLVDEIQDGDVSMVYSRARAGGSMGRRKLPPLLMESPSRGSSASPVYEFPSSCEIYPAGEMSVPPSPLLAGPAAKTRANLVSRFSMSSESVSTHSSFTDPAERQGLSDVDVDATFVFGSPDNDAHANADVLPQSPNKRATMDVSGSQNAEWSTAPRSPTRASLPTPPPSVHARYVKNVDSFPVSSISPTRRQPSVRTSASEPAPRMHRPASPFPLMRGVSDGSAKGRLGRHRGRTVTISPTSEGASTEGGESINDSGVYASVVMKDETQYDEDALDDSFVLPGEEMVHVLRPAPSVHADTSALANEHANADAEEGALTPRPISPSTSSTNVPTPALGSSASNTVRKADRE